MNRKLTFDRIGTTEDTGDPVIRAEFEDTESYLDAIIVQDEELIRVWMVESNIKGDMKKMMDEITSQLDIYDVHFLEPEAFELLGKEADIKQAVNGFERKEKLIDKPDKPGKIKSVYLEGRWNNE